MISPAIEELINRRAAEALAEIKRAAESARRSIGQRVRYARLLVKEHIDGNRL